MNVLDEINHHQRKLVDTLKFTKPVVELVETPYFKRKTSSLKDKFANEAVGIIAEFKRRSPSQPDINLSADPKIIVPGYAAAGAFGASILTNTKYFGGTEEDLMSVRELTDLPLLRKDFIIDEYQVYETKAMGADVMLLIAASLTREEVYLLSKLAHEIGLEVLLELKSLMEVKHVNKYIDLVGVNNRDLKNFKVDITSSEVLSFAIPGDAVRISESGISKPETIKHLEKYGYQGFLMGEHFMTKPDPVKACADFVVSIQG